MIEECPSCGLKLEKGFLTGYRIKWTKHSKTPPRFDDISERVQKRLPWPLTGESFVAYRCRDCNSIQFKMIPVRFSHSRRLTPDKTPHFDVSYIKRKKLLSKDSKSSQ